MEATLTIFQNGEAYYTSWISQTRDANLHRADQSSQSAICLAGIVPYDAQKNAMLHQQIDAAVRVLTLNQAHGTQPPSQNAHVDHSNAFSGLGWLLFQQLIPEPIQQQIGALQPGSTLQIVTNDPNLPWELLHDGDNFLALKHVVARLPILERAQAAHTLPRPTARAACLLLCNPTGDLSGAQEEIAAIEDMLYAARDRVRYLTLYGANISAIQLQNMLATQEYDLVHYAGHATPEALHLADGRFHIEEIRTALPNHPMVVLNACATGRAQAQANISDMTRGAQTLAAAFIEAGAPAVIGMLWPVPDETSRRFAEVLYGHLVNGYPVGQALWQSRQEMRRRDPNGISWMAPVLYGNPAWQLVPLAPKRAAGTLLAMRFQPSAAALSTVSSTVLADASPQIDHAHLIGLVCAEIRKHGGVILAANQAELLAVFGLYTATDLNTVQAIEAGQSVIALAAEQETAPPAIALSSGELTITAPSPSRETAHPPAPILTGDAVVEAQQLLDVAIPGQLLLNHLSYTRLKNRFSLRPWSNAPRESAGGTAYELTAAPLHVAPETAGLNMAATIGRDAELRRLLDAWEQVQNGHGRALGIRGEAGIGKTHLVQTFKQQLYSALNENRRFNAPIEPTENSGSHLNRSIEHTPAQWIQVACSLNVQNTPYGLLLRILRVLLALPDHATPERISAALATHFADQPDTHTNVLAELLGLQPALSARQEQSVYQHQLYQLLAHLLVARMEKGPIVLVLEDAHWSDPASLDVLTILAGQLEEAAILLLLIHRATWQSPWHGRDYFQSIHLRPLEAAARQQLYQSLLQTSELPAELVAILGRTSGNPFFLREILLTLTQKGLLTPDADAGGGWRLTSALETRDLPDSIQLVLDMRLEQLAPATRQVLNMAAVLGTNILPELLQSGLAVADEDLLTHLRILAEKDFLRRPLGSRAYEFRHDLFRDVAYMRIPVAQRQIWHRQVAQALEAVENQPRESFPLVAHHYYLSLVENDAAPATLNAASDPALIQKCLGYLMQSGQNALDSYGGHEAIAHYGRAQQVNALCIDAHARQAEILCGLGEAHQMLGQLDDAERAYQQAHAALHMQPLTQQNRPLAADLARRLARSFMRQAKYDVAEAWIETGLTHLAGHDEAAYQNVAALLHIHAGAISFDQGHLEKALHRCQTGLAIARKAGDRLAQAEGFVIMGVVQRVQGHYDEALHLYEQSLQIRTAFNDAFHIARLQLNMGLAYAGKTEWGTARELYEKAGAFAQSIHDQNFQAYCALNLGLVEQYSGNWSQAETLFRQALHLWERVGSQREIALCYSNLGTLRMEQNRWPEAKEQLEFCMQLLTGHAIEDVQADVLNGLAQVALAERRYGDARELACSALALAAKQNLRMDTAMAHCTLARIYTAEAQVAQAREHMQQSQAIMAEIGNRYEAARLQYHAACLEQNAQQVEQAIQLWSMANHSFHALGAIKDLERCERLCNRTK
ncbi:MAG: CHAT domain-containing protein [Caldilineaceae bacterium]|nr:CHAT domain-containing protein [Caldilineaceae bacterium]